jgi:hypothetical protein
MFYKTRGTDFLLISRPVKGISECHIFNKNIGDVDGSAAFCGDRNAMRSRAGQVLDMKIGARRANGYAVVAI